MNDIINRLVGFLDSMPAPAMIIDKDFTILYMNELGAKVAGKTPAADPWRQVLRPLQDLGLPQRALRLRPGHSQRAGCHQ